MKKLLLIAATTAALTTPAFAEIENSFYLKVNGGGNWMQDLKFEEGPKLKSKFAPMGVIGAGYYIMDNLRAELTGEMVFNPTYKTSGLDKDGEPISVELKGTTIAAGFLNAYVDLFDVSVAGVFIGGGIGVSHLKFERNVRGEKISSKAVTNFAYQVTAGVSTILSDNITAELAYSWRDYGKPFKKEEGDDNVSNIRGHNALIGIRFTF